MLVLRIGDPHVQHKNIEESDRLMEFALSVAKEFEVDRIEILGDLFHTHSDIRLEVLEFWDRWLLKLPSHFETIVLVGNHDQTGSYNNSSNSLSVFYNRKNLKIIHSSTLVDNFGYIPYIHNKDEFITEANKLIGVGAKVLICHQTFIKAKFENGMYAPDGIDIGLLTVPVLIISGHIHSKQRFDNVIYPGTPRWLTNSDANQDKGLWLVQHDDNTGIILKERHIDTSGVCTPIISMIWKEGDQMPSFHKNARNGVQLIGSSEWIGRQKNLLKGTCSISTKITDSKKIRWKSKSIDNTLETFIKEQFNIYTGLDKEKLIKYMKENNFV